MFTEEYKKDINRTYLVFSETEDLKSDKDGLQMLLQNEIKGILRLERRSIDNEEQYAYDITGMQKFSEVCQLKKLRKKELKNLLCGIETILENAATYFLEADSFVIRPECIYIKNDFFHSMDQGSTWLKESMLRLCYHPGNSSEVGLQFRQLFEYLLNQVDYEDEEAVALIYQLYQMSADQGITLAEIQEALKSDQGYRTRDEWRQERNADEAPVQNDWQSGGSQGNPLAADGKQSYSMPSAENPSKTSNGNPVCIILIAAMAVMPLIVVFLYIRGFFHSPVTGRLHLPKAVGGIAFLLAGEGILAYEMTKMRKTGGKQGKPVQPVNTLENQKPGERNQVDFSNPSGDRPNFTQKDQKMEWKNDMGMEKSKQKDWNMRIRETVPNEGIRSDLSKKGSYGEGGSSYKEPERTSCASAVSYQEMERERNMFCRDPGVPYGDTGRFCREWENSYGDTEKFCRERENSYGDSGKFCREPGNFYAEQNACYEKTEGNSSIREKEGEKANPDVCFENCMTGGIEGEKSLGMPKGETEEKTELLSDMERTVLLSEISKKRYQLIPINDNKMQKISVDEFPFFFGKIPFKEKNIIGNRTISRYHAKIEEENGVFFLTDLNSTNGTFLNHVRLAANQPSRLEPGDEVMFADVTYRFTLA